MVWWKAFWVGRTSAFGIQLDPPLLEKRECKQLSGLRLSNCKPPTQPKPNHKQNHSVICKKHANPMRWMLANTTETNNASQKLWDQIPTHCKEGHVGLRPVQGRTHVHIHKYMHIDMCIFLDFILKIFGGLLLEKHGTMFWHKTKLMMSIFSENCGSPSCFHLDRQW